MLFPGGGSGGERKYNGQNRNRIVSGCDNKYNYFNKMGKFVLLLDRLHFHIAACRTRTEAHFWGLSVVCIWVCVRLPDQRLASWCGQV